MWENNLEYKDLENIVVFAGPGSFTWIRTISLLVNTINFVINKNITSLNFFDLYKNYPIIKSSSKRDSFFKKDESSKIEVIKNDDILEYLSKNNITKVYWENKNLLSSTKEIILKTLLQMKDNPEGKEVLRKIQVDKYILPDPVIYDNAAKVRDITLSRWK